MGNINNDNFKKLSEKLPKEAIQRTKKFETKKGYDTDGYSYQFCVNRLNDVFGLNWSFSWDLLKETDVFFKTGAKGVEITVKLTISIEGVRRACVGGHIAITYSDALKGAITNAFKKTAAFFGVGRHAYEGTIDDDNMPYPDEILSVGIGNNIQDNENKKIQLIGIMNATSKEELIKLCKAAKDKYKDPEFISSLIRIYKEKLNDLQKISGVICQQ